MPRISSYFSGACGCELGPGSYALVHRYLQWHGDKATGYFFLAAFLLAAPLHPVVLPDDLQCAYRCSIRNGELPIGADIRVKKNLVPWPQSASRSFLAIEKN